MTKDPRPIVGDELRAALQRAFDAPCEDESPYWYPLAKPTYGIEEVSDALACLLERRTTMGARTREFETRFGERFGGEAVMVNSGSSADLLLAFALSERSGGPIPDGSEVLVPAVTWPTQVWSLLMAGFRVRLVDVSPETLNVDLDRLEAAISPDTRALSLVHLMGNPVDMGRVSDICSRHGLELLEDCCESMGAAWDGQPIGTFGHGGTFSFFFSHHITTMEGGMILVGDEDLADRLRLLRAHGWTRNLRHRPSPEQEGIDARYTFENWGFNVRPTDLQGAFGIRQLERFDEFTEHRNANVAAFASSIAEVDGAIRLMRTDAGGSCSWFALPLMVNPASGVSRDALAVHLERMGVETRPIVTGNLARQPAMRRFPEITSADLPGADAIHDHGLYIGLHPTSETADVERVGDAIAQFVRSAD